MKSFEELIIENQLPTKDDLTSPEHQITLFGFSIPFVEGIIKTPDVVLTMDIDTFMNFAKDHDVTELIGIVIPYDKTNTFITRELFEDDISDFTSVIIADYRLDLSETEQLEYVLDELDKSMEDIDEHSIDNDKPVLKLYDEDEDDEDDLLDTSEYSYRLTNTAQKLLNEIIEYNNSIPEEFFKIPEKIQLCCIINGVTYSILVKNTLSVDPTIILLEILSKYQSKYDSKIKDKIDKELKLQQLLEQQKIEKQQLHNSFITKILHDEKYLCLTNDGQREQYIKQIFTGQINDSDYTTLAQTVFPKVHSATLGVSNYQIREIRNEIKTIALQKGIKLGKR